MENTQENLGKNIAKPLRRMRPWMKFVAIVGFIESGFAVLGGLMMLVSFSVLPLSRANQTLSHGLFIFMGLMYLVTGALVFVPSFMLFRSAASLDHIEKNGTGETLAVALNRLHAFWKYVGICLIIGICLGLLSIATMIAFSFTIAASQLH